jgi:hypothetical protein
LFKTAIHAAICIPDFPGVGVIFGVSHLTGLKSSHVFWERTMRLHPRTSLFDSEEKKFPIFFVLPLEGGGERGLSVRFVAALS